MKKAIFMFRAMALAVVLSVSVQSCTKEDFSKFTNVGKTVVKDSTSTGGNYKDTSCHGGNGRDTTNHSGGGSTKDTTGNTGGGSTRDTTGNTGSNTKDTTRSI